MNLLKILCCSLLIWLGSSGVSAKPVHHYVFFGQDREKIKEAASFFKTKALEGAQVTYSGPQLEPKQDEYDFSYIREDLVFLSSKGKKLFIQLPDVTFSESRINVPRYLLQDAVYNGGADKQYDVKEGTKNACCRRWRRAAGSCGAGEVHKSSLPWGKKSTVALKYQFRRNVSGLWLHRTLFPRVALLKLPDAYHEYEDVEAAFQVSGDQYANFMPGEWPRRKTEDIWGGLRSCEASKVGGAALTSSRRAGQLKSSYPLSAKRQE